MFRWKRGLLHAAIPFALVIAAGLVALLATNPVDPDKAGEGIGRFAFFAFLAGLGVSYLAQTGRRKAALWTGLGLVAVIAAVTVSVIAASRGNAPKRLSAADRAPLVEIEAAGAHRLQHPTLGFSILRPPASYRDSPTMLAMMGPAIRDPDSVYYAFAETPPQAGLIVGVMSNLGESRAAFQHVIDGIRSGLADSARSQSETITYERNEITGSDAHLEAHVHALFGAIHIQVNAYSVHPQGRGTVIVSVTVIAPEPTTLADVLASFQP
jgi:hypothetical protein